MAQMHTSTISFHEVTSQYPTRSELKAGIYALCKLSGNLVKIPRDTYAIYNGNYSLYAPASAFPNAVVSKYDEKYNDLVKARDILKTDRYGYDADNIGAAIGLIKQFLDKNAKL
jgi:hypothetical protein